MFNVHAPKFFSKALCAVLSVSLSLAGVLPTKVSAQTFTCDPWAADRGTDLRCGSRQIGSVPVAYQKLQWTAIAEMPVSPAPGESDAISGGDAALTLANRAAMALGVEASQLASVVTAFPANVPYVFGRYNQLDGTLRIDVFKLEKRGVGASQRAGLYHAQFGPTHGDYWKAARAYITPDQFKSGLTAGVNPFETFKEAGTDNFRNISLSGAQVAMGHAMRLVGAPLGVFASTENRLSQTTTKSGNALVKKTTVRVYGHAKPRWYIAQPLNLLSRPSTGGQAAFCVSNPAATDCPLYSTAAAGVSFEEFDGGTLSAEENTWLIDQKSKSGLGFLGALIIGVVASFALGPLLGAIGIGSGGAGAVAGAASASGVTMGTMGTFLTTNGFISGLTQFGAIALETAVTTASLALAGASLSSTIAVDAGLLLGAATVQQGTLPTMDTSDYEKKISQRVTPLVTSSLAAGPGQALTGYDKTVMGACSPGASIASCPGSSGGMILRVDQYTETNEVQFVRDNGGHLLRDDKDPGYDPTVR